MLSQIQIQLFKALLGLITMLMYVGALQRVSEREKGDDSKKERDGVALDHYLLAIKKFYSEYVCVICALVQACVCMSVCQIEKWERWRDNKLILMCGHAKERKKSGGLGMGNKGWVNNCSSSSKEEKIELTSGPTNSFFILCCLPAPLSELWTMIEGQIQALKDKFDLSASLLPDSDCMIQF